MLPSEKLAECGQCHMPGQKTNFRDGLSKLLGAAKDGKPYIGGDFGSWWIDMAGMIVLPIALAFVVIHGALRKAVKR